MFLGEFINEDNTKSGYRSSVFAVKLARYRVTRQRYFLREGLKHTAKIKKVGMARGKGLELLLFCTWRDRFRELKAKIKCWNGYISSSEVCLDVHNWTAALSWDQWSFRITETIGTLASQAEIDVWVQEPGALLWGVRGYHPGQFFFEIVCAKFCNLMHFWPENCSQCRLQCILKHVNNGNAVHTRFRSKWPLVRTDGTWKGKALSRWSSVLCTMRLFKVAQEVHSMLLSALVLLDQIHCSR